MMFKRINEDFLDTEDNRELAATEVEADSSDYDAALMLVIPKATSVLLKKIHKLITLAPIITRADELETRTDDNSMEIFAGEKTFHFTFVGSYTFHHLAYGLKGNLGNIRAALRLFIQLNQKFPGVIDAVGVFDMDKKRDDDDDVYFRLSTINTISTFLSGNNDLLTMRDFFANEFSELVKSLSVFCKRPVEDVLEVLLDVFNLSEVYLVADIHNNVHMIRYEVARVATDILKKHTPEHFSVFKKSVQNASFFDSDNDHFKNSVQLCIHSTRDFLGNNQYLSSTLNMDESAARDDIAYPQHAVLGVRCPDDSWWNQWFEYVVPYTIDSAGVIMLVIHVGDPEWMLEALEILYPDLSESEKQVILEDMRGLQKKQMG
jgi:hypothetical protein